MKKGTFFILLALLLINCSMRAEKEVVRQEFVFDYEQILTKDHIDSLNTLFENLKKETTYQIVLVTTPDYGKHTKNVEYAVEFGNTHDVNGVVIVFSKAKREVFVATGYGIEYFLDDVTVKRIIDELMIPKFRKDDYFGGLYAGSKVIVEFLN